MSISDAINNARNKINNVYNALEAKGAPMPEVRNLDHMVTTVENLTEFESTFEYWAYNGAWGSLNLTSYFGGPMVRVPFQNYLSMSNTIFKGNASLWSISCNNVPFQGTSVASAFASDSGLQSVGGINVPDGVTTAQAMFSECHWLKGAYVNLPSTTTVGTQMFLNCKNCYDVALAAPGLSTMVNTFALVNTAGYFGYYNVVLTSPNITSVTNFWRNYNPSDRKNIYIYYRYSNGEYTPTFNSFKGETYMGTTGNNTSSYIQPRYNHLSGFNIFDITSVGGVSNLKDFLSFTNGSLKYIGAEGNSNKPINIPQNLVFKVYPDSEETQVISVTDMSNTFNRYNGFNQPVQIPNSVINMSHTFNKCSSFNQSIQIPNSVTNMSNTFFDCSNFNQPVQIGSNVTNMHAAFSYCTSLNQPIIVPNSVLDMSNTFNYCQNFNQPIQIGSNVVDMSWTFYDCVNFNQNIRIPNNVISMYGTFYDCSNLNQNIQIPNSVINMSSTFQYCRNFNKNIQIPSSVVNMSHTFSYCYNLNQPIRIGSNVSDMSSTFYYCNKLSYPIQIPNSVINISNTFNNCTSLTGRINVLSRDITNASNCFSGTTLPKNVYIPFTYSNGVNSATFNSFVTAGYLYANGVSNNQDGVMMHNLNA